MERKGERTRRMRGIMKGSEGGSMVIQFYGINNNNNNNNNNNCTN